MAVTKMEMTRATIIYTETTIIPIKASLCRYKRGNDNDA